MLDILRKQRDLFKPLYKLNLWKTLLTITCDYAWIAYAIYLSTCANSKLIYFIALIIIASRMRALENLVHEASHVNLHRNKTINNLIGLLFCAIPIGSSIQAYRKSHMLHHTHLGVSNVDPDLIRYQLLGLENLPNGRLNFFINLLKIVSLYNVPKYIYGTFRTFIFNKDSDRYELITRGLTYLTLFTTIQLTHTWNYFLFYWLVPYLTIFQVIRFFAEVAEHGGLYQEKNQEQMTRNNFCHPVLRFILFPHNDSFHLVHHLLPTIPFYNTPKAHAQLMNIAEYRKLHHCNGFIFPANKNATTSLSELV